MNIEEIGSFAETTKVYLTSPINGEALTFGDEPLWIEVYGTRSAKYKGLIHRVQNERLRKMQRTGSNSLNLTAEQIAESGMDMLVACTKAWYIGIGASEIAFSTEAVRDLYTKYEWIKDQIDRGMANDEAFLGN